MIIIISHFCIKINFFKEFFKEKDNTCTLSDE